MNLLENTYYIWNPEYPNDQKKAIVNPCDYNNIVASILEKRALNNNNIYNNIPDFSFLNILVNRKIKEISTLEANQLKSLLQTIDILEIKKPKLNNTKEFSIFKLIVLKRFYEIIDNWITGNDRNALKGLIWDIFWKEYYYILEQKTS